MFTPRPDHASLWSQTKGPSWARHPRVSAASIVHAMINERARGGRPWRQSELSLSNTLHVLKLARSTRTSDEFVAYLRDMGYRPHVGANPHRARVARRWLTRIYFGRLERAACHNPTILRDLRRLRVPLESWPHVLRSIAGDLTGGSNA